MHFNRCGPQSEVGMKMYEPFRAVRPQTVSFPRAKREVPGAFYACDEVTRGHVHEGSWKFQPGILSFMAFFLPFGVQVHQLGHVITNPRLQHNAVLIRLPVWESKKKQTKANSLKPLDWMQTNARHFLLYSWDESSFSLW